MAESRESIANHLDRLSVERVGRRRFERRVSDMAHATREEKRRPDDDD
jgi:hypothetical protein